MEQSPSLKQKTVYVAPRAAAEDDGRVDGDDGDASITVQAVAFSATNLD